MNSSRQTSDITRQSSPTSSTRRPNGGGQDAVRIERPEPRASLRSGTPKSMTPARPASAASTAALRSVSRVCCTTPGMELIGRGSRSPSANEHGQDQLARLEAGLGNHGP